MPVIKEWLENATSQLRSLGIDSANLDAEILLSNVLSKNRTYLHAHPDNEISKIELTKANNDLGLRLHRIPIAYITGTKEFYGRNFTVTPHTLVPRPESEIIIERLLQISKTNKNLGRLVDVGTGTGCLGITAKLELPELQVTLVDIDTKTLDVASRNAINLLADVKIVNSDLLNEVAGNFDFIIANLPYVDRSWDRSTETDHEPKHALFADDFGKSIIIDLMKQTPKHLTLGGYLIIEADPRQHSDLVNEALSYSLKLISKQGYIIVFRKILA